VSDYGLHRLLKRQIKKVWGNIDTKTLPQDVQILLNLVEKTYKSFDRERNLLENTISINTEELRGLNKKIEMDGERRLKGLMEQAPYGFIIIRLDGTIRDVNKFACDVLGYQRDEFLKLNANTLFSSLSKYLFEEIKSKAIDKDEKLSFDDQLKDANNNLIPVEITTAKFMIKNNPYLLVMFQDIIERVEAERISAERQKEIEELNRSLEERVKEEVAKNFEKDQLLIQQSKMAAIGDMMGNIAHQWRQPLNTLALAVQDLEEAFLYEEVDEEYIKNFVDLSMDNIHFMSKTIDDFRNFFKPSKTKEIFKLRDAIEDILKIVSAQLRNKNISISVTGEDYSVIGYPNEFKQVMLNLTNNAKDAILAHRKDGGEIKISILPAPEKEYREVRIEDNGGGVPEDIIDKIFEPYFTTKEGNKGTGIGLYMSKTIIEDNMKGKLRLTNIKDGARFSIFIPCVCDSKSLVI